MIQEGDTLDVLGLSPAAARIIRYFLIRPEARPHARELQRTLELGGASLQRELDRMVTLGALRKKREGRRTLYGVCVGRPLWKAMRILEAAARNPAPLLRDALADVSGLHAAFVFGSTARGEEREDSDIDIFIVGEPEADRKKLLRHLAEAEMILGREVNAIRYRTQELADRLGNPAHPAWGFVRRVLMGPKEWVAGGAPALAPLVAAAGLSPEDFTEVAA